MRYLTGARISQVVALILYLAFGRPPDLLAKDT